MAPKGPVGDRLGRGGFYSAAENLRSRSGLETAAIFNRNPCRTSSLLSPYTDSKAQSR